MVVMKPDVFDVENKAALSQQCLMKNAAGWTCCCSSDNTDNWLSVNDSKAGIV